MDGLPNEFLDEILCLIVHAADAAAAVPVRHFRHDLDHLLDLLSESRQLRVDIDEGLQSLLLDLCLELLHGVSLCTCTQRVYGLGQLYPNSLTTPLSQTTPEEVLLDLGAHLVTYNA